MTYEINGSSAAQLADVRSALGVSREGRQARKFSVVADNTNTFNGSSKSVTTGGTYDSYRTLHTNRTGKVITSLVLVYANWAVAGGTEVANPNQINVIAAYESAGTVSDQSGPRYRAFFNGLILLTLDGRGVGYSAPIPCWIAPGASFYIRTGATTPGNSQVFQRGIGTRGGTSAFGADTGEGADAGANKIADSAGTITANAQTAIYSPSAILGTLQDGSVAASVSLIGDSISNGVDDAAYGYGQGGWAIRALAGYPMINVAISGEKLNDFIDLKKSYARYELSALGTTVLDAYGRNDVEQSRTTAEIKADILSNAFRFMSRGQRYIKSTILPAPSSTDGYYTTTNQTAQTAAKEDVRVAVNDWIRDTSASGFVAQANAQVAAYSLAGDAKFVDPCAGIEVNAAGALTQNGGLVAAVQTGGKLVTGTATSGTTTSVTLTGAGWTVNAYKGKALYISGGTGSGQSRCIGYNTATVLTVLNAFSVAPDSTSTFEIFESTMNGVHPTTALSVAAAASVNMAAVVS